MKVKFALIISITILLIVCSIAIYYSDKLTDLGLAWIIVLCLTVIALLLSINRKINVLDEENIPLPKTRFNYSSSNF